MQGSKVPPPRYFSVLPLIPLNIARCQKRKYKRRAPKNALLSVLPLIPLSIAPSGIAPCQNQEASKDSKSTQFLLALDNLTKRSGNKFIVDQRQHFCVCIVYCQFCQIFWPDLIVIHSDEFRMVDSKFFKIRKCLCPQYIYQESKLLLLVVCFTGYSF